MDVEKRTGRTVGLLLYLQLAGLIVPFVLLLPLSSGPKNYLRDAVGASTQVRTAVLLLFANGALTIGLSIVASRVLRQYGEGMSQWLLAASVCMFLLQSVDNIHLLSMLSLSEQYAATSASDSVALAMATALGSARRWTHTTELLVIDCWVTLFFAFLLRTATVPRALAIFGLITVTLHFVGIPLPSLVGSAPIVQLGPPMALSHLALATWLLFKGFSRPLTSSPA